MDELTIGMLPLNEEKLAWGGGEPESWYTDMIQEIQDNGIAYVKQRQKRVEMQKIADYQTMLKQAGYYKGQIDGIWGRQTDAADKQYEKDVSGEGPRVIVQRGDTLSKIANKYGVTVEQIMAINPKIKDRNKIWVDQVINLPSFIQTSSQKSNTSNKQSQQKQSQKPQNKATATNAGQNRQDAPHLKKDYTGFFRMLDTTPRSILNGRIFFQESLLPLNIPPQISDKWEPGMPLTGGYTPF